MATFGTVTVAEAKRMAVPPRVATQLQYREYVEQVQANPEVAGRLELEEGDRPITERARLKSAAKAEGVNLHIQRRGYTIVFWPSDEAPRQRRSRPRLVQPEPEPELEPAPAPSRKGRRKIS